LQAIACRFIGHVIKQAQGDIDMPFNNIPTEKAFRSYKNITGHPQAKALAALQREILRVVDNIKTSRKLMVKYPDNAAGDREMLLRHYYTLYSLLNVKRALRG